MVLKYSKLFSAAESWLALPPSTYKSLEATTTIFVKQIINYKRGIDPPATNRKIMHAAHLRMPDTHIKFLRLSFLRNLAIQNNLPTKALMQNLSKPSIWQNTPPEIFKEALLWLSAWHHTKHDLHRQPITTVKRLGYSLPLITRLHGKPCSTQQPTSMINTWLKSNTG